MTPDVPAASARARWMFCGLALLAWAGYLAAARSRYADVPVGDASYYTNMSYAFLEPHRNEIPISTIHGKRILVPFLVHLGLRASGLDTAPKVVWRYNPLPGEPDGWSAHQARAYRRIHGAWQIVNTAAFAALVVFLNLLIPRLPLPTFAAYATTLILTPSLAFLSALWPQMGDLTCLALFAGALWLLSRERTAAGLALLALASLAREQVLFLLPLVFFVTPLPLWKVACALVPYALVTAFPVFANQQPFVDNSSAAAGTSTLSSQAYLDILRYHASQLFSAHGLLYPLSILVNFGATWVLARACGLQRDKVVAACLLLCFLFIADRHMVVLNLVALYAVARKARDAAGAPRFELAVLWVLTLFKAYLLVRRRDVFMQLEYWDRLVKPAPYYLASALGLVAWAALLAAPVVRSRLRPSSAGS
jgi:hypothetical protein